MLSNIAIFIAMVQIADASGMTRVGLCDFERERLRLPVTLGDGGTVTRRWRDHSLTQVEPFASEPEVSRSIDSEILPPPEEQRASRPTVNQTPSCALRRTWFIRVSEHYVGIFRVREALLVASAVRVPLTPRPWFITEQ
jgi:hypothetical protein